MNRAGITDVSPTAALIIVVGALLGWTVIIWGAISAWQAWGTP